WAVAKSGTVSTRSTIAEGRALSARRTVTESGALGTGRTIAESGAVGTGCAIAEAGTVVTAFVAAAAFVRLRTCRTIAVRRAIAGAGAAFVRRLVAKARLAALVPWLVAKAAAGFTAVARFVAGV